MPDYKQGRIYKIVSPCGMTYYGSTTQRICNRMKNHINEIEKNRNKDCTANRVIDAGGEIYLVEMYPCNSEDELKAREAWYIRYRPCVNVKIPGRTWDEYYQDNRGKLLAYQKEYRTNNKEKVIARNKRYYQNNKQEINRKNKLRDSQKYNCECGSTCRRGDKSKHFRTKKHMMWIENNKQ